MVIIILYKTYIFILNFAHIKQLERLEVHTMIEMSFIEMIIRNESENKEAARLLMKDIMKGNINKQTEEDTLG